MDYKEKYEIALEGIQEILGSGEDSIKMSRLQLRLQGIFPELKESEDEKIRKALIEYYSFDKDGGSHALDNITPKQIVAWLEKQSIDISSFPEEQQVFMQKYTDLDKITLIKLLAERDANNAEIIESFEKQGEQKLVEPQQDMLSQEKYAKAVDECVYGEQKPVDKVKPKFHEGEWITDGYYTWKIVEVKPLDYILQSQDGNIVDGTIFHMDKQFHSFTIKDAEDGDVLCTYECDEPKIVFILKGTPKKPYVLGYHCFYNIMYPSFKTDDEKGCLAPKAEDIKPATKEQRDTLMKAMTDAGYTFDFEKKELKEIWQKQNTNIQINSSEYINDMGGNGCYLKNTTQNPVWSEEDEKRLQSCLNVLQARGIMGVTETVNTKWLKSLKDRVQPKQEWSDEDEEIRSALIKYLGNSDALSVDLASAIYWLKSLRPKSNQEVDEQIETIAMHLDNCGDTAMAEILRSCNLRPQNTWKPSDEQMNALREAVLEMGKSVSRCSIEEFHGIESLYNDLKKLREE